MTVKLFFELFIALTPCLRTLFAAVVVVVVVLLAPAQLCSCSVATLALLLLKLNGAVQERESGSCMEVISASLGEILKRSLEKHASLGEILKHL